MRFASRLSDALDKVPAERFQASIIFVGLLVAWTELSVMTVSHHPRAAPITWAFGAAWMVGCFIARPRDLNRLWRAWVTMLAGLIVISAVAVLIVR